MSNTNLFLTRKKKKTLTYKYFHNTLRKISEAFIWIYLLRK